NLILDPIALTLVPSVAFGVAAMWHFCDLTKDHKRSWIGPGLLALALAIATTFQAAALIAATPLDFVNYGAFYSPMALWNEPWRFATSVFLYEDPILALVSCLTVAIVGCRLSHHVGFRGFLYTFALSSIAGIVAASVMDAQTLVVGATAGAFGLANTTLFLGGWRASDYVERIARGVAIAFVVTCVARFYANEDMTGACAAAGGTFAAFAIWITYRQPTTARRGLSGSAAFALAACATLLVPPAFDLIGVAEMARRKERETFARLAGLESARSKSWISEGEFADRLQSEILAPLDEIIDASASWS
ncbi:MAG: rhomboid family intramembrane serine protease, partial [Bdellovibrionota bacterium]